MFLVDPKVFRLVVMGVKVIFLGVGVTIESYGKLENFQDVCYFQNGCQNTA